MGDLITPEVLNIKLHFHSARVAITSGFVAGILKSERCERPLSNQVQKVKRQKGKKRHKNKCAQQSEMYRIP